MTLDDATLDKIEARFKAGKSYPMDMTDLVREVRRLRSALVLIEDRAIFYEGWARYEQRGRQVSAFRYIAEYARDHQIVPS